MPIKKALILILCCIALSLYADTTVEKWELRKDDAGVKVWSRSVPGSDLKELKATITIHTSLNALMALLMDVQGFANWVYHCKQSYELKRLSPHEVFYYQETAVPWPLDNRDLIIHSVWEQDEKTKAISLHGIGVGEYIPEKSGIVRMTKFKSSWSLIPKAGGMVEVEYQVSVDPAGFVPAWLVNLSSVDGPYQTCLSIQEHVKDVKYQNSTHVVKEL